MICERSLDELKDFGIKLIQPLNGFKVNVDTILLAGFAKAKRGERVCELGCAHGAISLILARRSEVAITALDIQQDLVDMARENADINGLSDRVSFLHCDLREAQRLFPPQSFDVVLSNPPYGDPKRHRQSLNQCENVARHGVTCSLDDLGTAISHLLKHGGRAYTVFTSERVVALMESMRSKGLEPKVILPVYPKEGRDSSVFLMKSIKGAAPGLRLLPPVFIGDEDGRFTDSLLSFYKVEGCPCP